MARIHHADLWGLEKAKGDWLEGHDATDTPWEDIEPSPDFYLFLLSSPLRDRRPPAALPLPSEGLTGRHHIAQGGALGPRPPRGPAL